MSGFDKEMQDALRADAEKLRAMGADVADPVFLEPTNCGPKASGWRDIESDPPEPTREEILCYEPSAHDDNGKELWVEFYYVTTGYALKNQYACGTEDQNPTHWQPLPPPPGEEDGECERERVMSSDNEDSTPESTEEDEDDWLDDMDEEIQMWTAESAQFCWVIHGPNGEEYTMTGSEQVKEITAKLNELEDLREKVERLQKAAFRIEEIWHSEWVEKLGPDATLSSAHQGELNGLRQAFGEVK